MKGSTVSLRNIIYLLGNEEFVTFGWKLFYTFFFMLYIE